MGPLRSRRDGNNGVSSLSSSTPLTARLVASSGSPGGLKLLWWCADTDRLLEVVGAEVDSRNRGRRGCWSGFCDLNPATGGRAIGGVV